MKDVFGSHTTCWKVRLLTIHGLCSPHGHGLQVASGKMPTTSNERFLKPLCFYPLCIWGMLEEKLVVRNRKCAVGFLSMATAIISGQHLEPLLCFFSVFCDYMQLWSRVWQALFFDTSSSIFTSTAQVTTYFSNCLLFCANKPLKRVSWRWGIFSILSIGFHPISSMLIMHVSYIMLSPPPVYGPNKYAPRFHHKLNSCFNGWCPNCSQRNAAPAPCVQIWCGTLKVHAQTCNVKKKKLRVCIAFIHIGNQLAPRAQSSMS